MKIKKTYYQLILDRSGSMSSCIEETIEGVNKQICRIKEMSERLPDQELITSLSIFNQNTTPVWTRKRASQLTEVFYSDYRPDGRTALLDAVGISVNALKDTIEWEIANDEATVVVVIITDGYENSSAFYTQSQISELIEGLEKTGKWSFSYIGTTFDTYEVAGKLSIKKQNTMYFSFSETPEMYERVNMSLESYLHTKQSGGLDNNLLGNDEKNE